MATKDYLHSDLLSQKRNDLVFQETYKLIDKLARKQTEIMVAAFDLHDNKHIAELEKMNALNYSDDLIELVNYTIENFNKRAKNGL